MAGVFSSNSFYSKSAKLKPTSVYKPQQPIFDNVLKSSENHLSKITETSYEIKNFKPKIVRRKVENKREKQHRPKKVTEVGFKIKKSHKECKEQVRNKKKVESKEKVVNKEKVENEIDLNGRELTNIGLVQYDGGVVGGSTKRFFRHRGESGKRNFTKDLFQPRLLNNPFSSQRDANLSLNLSTYKLMSNYFKEEYEDCDEESNDSGDDSSDEVSGDDDSRDGVSGDGHSGCERDEKLLIEVDGGGMEEGVMGGVEFSLVSDDDDDDDDVLNGFNDKMWDQEEEEEDGMELNSPQHPSATNFHLTTHHIEPPSNTTPHHTQPPSNTTPQPPSQHEPPSSVGGGNDFDADESPRLNRAPNKTPPKLYQMTLDFGQKLKEPMVCKGCGLTYNGNESHDAAFHQRYHKQFLSCFQYNIRQKDDVVGSYEDGCVVLLSAAVINSLKMERVLQEVDKELGFVKSQHGSSQLKVFVYVREARIVGLCTAESVKLAYRMKKEDTGRHTHLHSLEMHQSTPEDPSSLPSSSSSSSPLVSSSSSPLVSSSSSPLASASSSSVPPESASSSSASLERARVGVERIWVEQALRRRGIAGRLLHAVQGFFCLGVPLEPSDFAFLDPSQDAAALATHFNNSSHFLAYYLSTPPYYP